MSGHEVSIHPFFSRGDRRAVGMALLLSLLLFLLPLLAAKKSTPGTGPVEGHPAPLGQQDVPAQAARDRGRPVRLLQKDGEVVEMTMEDYLWGVVAAEMPASFEPEALKAQACAARTYTAILQNKAEKKHQNADICGDSSCCQAYIPREDAQARWGLKAKAYTKKIQDAVNATDGLGILYDGKPIQALFFSSAAGKTVDAVEVWGNSVAYLKSVSSPEGAEVPNYNSKVVLSAAEVQEKAKAAYPAVNLSADPGTWFGQPVLGPSGAVSSVLLGGVTLTGGQVRNLFGLRSASFTIQWDGTNFTFQVTGHGHGVGMSQYGANTMAKNGSNFQDILSWYYTGVEVSPLW